MKIKESLVRKLVISGMRYIDPISVFLEDFDKGEGTITFSCEGESWSNYWGSMGTDLTSFIIKASTPYIMGKITNIKSTVVDLDILLDNAKKITLDRRKDREIDKEEAAEIWSELSCYWGGNDLYSDHDLMYKVYGDEWWCSKATTEKPNPDYVHICNIVDAVKEGLQRHKNECEQRKQNMITMESVHDYN